MKNIEALTKIATPFDIHNVFLCFINIDQEEEFSSIADVLEFGSPNDLDEKGGEELELMNDHIYVFSTELDRFIIVQ